MNFKELTEFCQAEALASKLDPDEEAVWRYMARIYSKKFSTPLTQVLEMNPAEVILHVYEDQLDELDSEENLEKILDMIYTLDDPDYEQEKSDELDRFIELAEFEEQERIKKGKPIHPGLKNEVSLKNTPKKEKAPEDNLPTGGSIDLSYLAKEETEGGFDR